MAGSSKEKSGTAETTVPAKQSTEEVKTVKMVKCGNCEACLRDSCGECKNCLNRHLKKGCLKKKCPYKKVASTFRKAGTKTKAPDEGGEANLSTASSSRKSEFTVEQLTQTSQLTQQTPKLAKYDYGDKYSAQNVNARKNLDGTVAPASQCPSHICKWEGCAKWPQQNCNGYCLTHVKSNYEEFKSNYEEDGMAVTKVRVRIDGKLPPGFGRAVLSQDVLDKSVEDERKPAAMEVDDDAAAKKTNANEGKVLYKCPECDKTNLTRHGLAAHYGMVHKTPENNGKVDMATVECIGVGTDAERKAKPAAPKEKGPPKPLNAYLLFSKEVRPGIQGENPDFGPREMVSEKDCVFGRRTAACFNFLNSIRSDVFFISYSDDQNQRGVEGAGRR